jgi:hypothetical protein
MEEKHNFEEDDVAKLKSIEQTPIPELPKEE